MRAGGGHGRTRGPGTLADLGASAPTAGPSTPGAPTAPPGGSSAGSRGGGGRRPGPSGDRQCRRGLGADPGRLVWRDRPEDHERRPPGREDRHRPPGTVRLAAPGVLVHHAADAEAYWQVMAPRRGRAPSSPHRVVSRRSPSSPLTSASIPTRSCSPWPALPPDASPRCGGRTAAAAALRRPAAGGPRTCPPALRTPGSTSAQPNASGTSTTVCWPAFARADLLLTPTTPNAATNTRARETGTRPRSPGRSTRADIRRSASRRGLPARTAVLRRGCSWSRHTAGRGHLAAARAAQSA